MWFSLWCVNCDGSILGVLGDTFINPPLPPSLPSTDRSVRSRITVRQDFRPGGLQRTCHPGDLTASGEFFEEQKECLLHGREF
jgi:hypothetical protein